MSILVSIIIPNYNNGNYIKNALDSIENQTYSNVEVIIVDDCSTDDSVEIINNLMSEYTFPINLYLNKKNKKVSYSRNKGILLARGDYITTLDPDDCYFPDKIEQELDVFRVYGNNVIAYSGIVIVDEQLNYIREDIGEGNFVDGKIYKGMLYRIIPFSRDMMLPSHIAKKYLYDETVNLYEDWDLKLRLAKEYNYYFSHSKGVKYRQVAKGLSSVDKEVHKQALVKIYKRHNGNRNIEMFILLNSSVSKYPIFSKIIKRFLRFNLVSNLVSKVLVCNE
ncbi:TPA: glycosyltransferase family 2 protein [Photobacterium damselae]